MHQQRLHRVAGTVALRLGVVGDADRHVDVGVFVDEHVTDAVQMLDHRHRGFVGHALDQALAAARHQHVDVAVHRREHAHGGTVGSRDRLHRILGQAGGGKALVQAGCDRLVRAHRFGAAAQDRRIARLEAQRGGVGGHVRPRFVDYADDAERHAHSADLDAGRTVFELGDLTHRIGQCRDLAQTLGHRGDAFRVQRQPVDECLVVAGGARSRDIASVRCEQQARIAFDRRRRGFQRRVLCPRRRSRDDARRGARAFADLAHVRGEIEMGNAQVRHGRILVLGARTG